MALVTSNLELLAALRAGALRNSELAYSRYLPAGGTDNVNDTVRITSMSAAVDVGRNAIA